METIEVRYKEVALDRYHKYIVYTDSNGNQFAARGGSADGGPSSGWSFPPGDITTVHGPFDGNFPDPPNDTDPIEEITRGDDLSKEWERITDAMDDIEREGHEYDIDERNSNTTVDESLRRAGAGRTLGESAR